MSTFCDCLVCGAFSSLLFDVSAVKSPLASEVVGSSCRCCNNGIVASKTCGFGGTLTCGVGRAGVLNKSTNEVGSITSEANGDLTAETSNNSDENAPHTKQSQKVDIKESYQQLSTSHFRLSFPHKYQHESSAPLDTTINMTYLVRHDHTVAVEALDHQIYSWHGSTQWLLPYSHLFTIRIIPWLYINQHPTKIFKESCKDYLLSNWLKVLDDEFAKCPDKPIQFDPEDIPIPSLDCQSPILRVYEVESFPKEQQEANKPSNAATVLQIKPDLLSVQRVQFCNSGSSPYNQHCPHHVIILCCNEVRRQGELPPISESDQNGYKQSLRQAGVLNMEQYHYLKKHLPFRYKSEMLFRRDICFTWGNFERANALLFVHFVTVDELPQLIVDIQADAINRRLSMYKSYQ
jgi:hypothetical protein